MKYFIANHGTTFNGAKRHTLRVKEGRFAILGMSNGLVGAVSVNPHYGVFLEPSEGLEFFPSKMAHRREWILLAVEAKGTFHLSLVVADSVDDPFAFTDDVVLDRPAEVPAEVVVDGVRQLCFAVMGSDRTWYTTDPNSRHTSCITVTSNCLPLLACYAVEGCPDFLRAAISDSV